MKKKIVAMMLASMMAFNLIGCGETQKESNAPEEKQESIESEEGSDEKGICQVKCVNFFIFYRRSDLDRRFDVISLIGIIIGKASHILPHRAVGVLVNQNKSHQFEENTDSSSHAVRSLFLLLTSHQTNPVILSRLAKH